MFTPKLFGQQQYYLSGKTAADAFEAERQLLKIDEQLSRLQLGPAVANAMARLEAVSTVRIDGLDPSWHDVLIIDSLFSSEQSRYFNYNISGSSFCTKSASMEAFYYLETLRWIKEVVTPGFKFTPQFILDVHSRCLYNKDADQTGVRFRSRDFKVEKNSLGAETFQPPHAEDLMGYIEDLCNFVSTPCFSPLVQVGYMHFQFESIKPFRAAMDRTGRALCHALFRSRDLVNNVIPSIALLPAIDTPQHAMSLLPYDRAGKFENGDEPTVLNRWIEFCAHSIALAWKVKDAYLNAFMSLKEHWGTQVGKLSAGSVARIILDYLPGYPIFTVESACKLTGKSFGACNDALRKLESAGVLSVVGSGGYTNSRLFEAKEATAALERIESTLLSSPPIPRTCARGTASSVSS